MEDFKQIQHRERQRQEIIEKFKDILYKKEDKFLENIPEEIIVRGRLDWWCVLTIALLTKESKERKGLYNFFVAIPSDDWKQTLMTWVSMELFPAIELFTPNKHEQRFLLFCLAEFTLSQVGSPLQSAMTRHAIEPDRTNYLKEIGFTK